MFQSFKKALYFPLAYYFRFFAQIKLSRWKPRIIIVTGSSGKTTLLHLIEAQLGENACYSHHANSSYGIPFDILDLSRKTLMSYEWFELFLKTPFLTFSKVPKQKIYIVEADCDRPGEGKFLSTFLKPEVTIWLSSSRTHSMNFDNLVEKGKFKNVDEAIAFEYGYFLEATNKLAIVNSDLGLINRQLSRSQAKKIEISNKSLQKYEVSKGGSIFKINNNVYKFKFLLPEATSYSILAALTLTKYVNLPLATSFQKFEMPPGRSSMFQGIRGITIIDSCYNSNFSSASEIINMLNKIRGNKKWVVIGDLLEQGRSEKEEHERLAQLIVQSNYDRVVLLGPRIVGHGLEILKKHYGDNVVAFMSPKEVLDYLKNNLEGGEMILFKGARFLEGVIENLLENKEDAAKLARREKVWEIRRKKWGL
ncbi:MAG: hypothetical protein A2868_01985 [Candidatus Levybacteria bacterium RIFCSPHIGHO2_01_FULL_40_15b]|nr:MAG: hypothetical protein A2868_01985 [Candidatus Levybacteria bacterium RIFCSPHIGHO2_01_FULL_40_15b]